MAESGEREGRGEFSRICGERGWEAPMAFGERERRGEDGGGLHIDPLPFLINLLIGLPSLSKKRLTCENIYHICAMLDENGGDMASRGQMDFFFPTKFISTKMFN